MTTTELGDKILRVIEEHEHSLDATTILDILEKEGVEIPKYNGLYDVNEFIDLSEEQYIMWDEEEKGWRLMH